MTLAHVSDTHFGKITSPEIIDALVSEINSNDVDLVAISGDLTQRARRSEYVAAAAMIDAFSPPVLVVPGNHDVYPWWYPFRRVLNPLARYERFINTDHTPVFEREGLAVLGVNSAHGRTIKGGQIDHIARSSIGTFFEEKEAGDFKVIVIHHHLTKIQALGPHDVARKAKKALEIASHVGVDLILCGHLHISHIEPIELVPDEHRLVIASAGTATSTRGRRSNRETNFYNLVEISDSAFVIRERCYNVTADVFGTERTTEFDRA